MSRRNRTMLVLIVAVIAAGYASGRVGGGDAEGVDGPGVPDGAHSAVVERVVDGDTVVLAGRGKARLIGVDTPEVFGSRECFGPQASDYAKHTLTDQPVKYTVGREPRDRYGRLLVYVWLPDGRSFNALLAARGYARTLTIEPNDRYAPTFARLARDARAADVGLWGAGCPAAG